jgi:hypothetical protein
MPEGAFLGVDRHQRHCRRLVLVEVDFPRRKALSPEQEKANEALAEKYNPEGLLPTLGGQTGPTLTLNNVTTSQSGNYDLVASNVMGTATSQVAGLSVIQPPAITTQPQSQATIVSANVTFTVVASGTPTPVLSLSV